MKITDKTNLRYWSGFLWMRVLEIRHRKWKKLIRSNIHLLVCLRLVTFVFAEDPSLRCIYSIGDKQYQCIDVDIVQLCEYGKLLGIYIGINGLLWQTTIYRKAKLQLCSWCMPGKNIKSPMTLTSETNFDGQAWLCSNESPINRAEKMKKLVGWNIQLLMRLPLVKWVAIVNVNMDCILGTGHKQYRGIDVGIGQMYEYGKTFGIYFGMNGLLS